MNKPPGRPSTSAPSSERAKAFRDRLEEMELTRWEIVASEQTKLKVRAIASSEGITSGVAAEALLQLGIEAYEAGAMQAPVVLSAKSLASYATRSQPGSSPREQKAAAPLQGFFDRAKQRKAR